ncbi:hypothetical protein OC713_02695, partial [Sweet potato little leaf phytoplasma]|uniref:hypothetical protein n=1 Tax=Candidatus Phytoplasma australasiaticum TaxID=2754999 RepID=UPI002713007A
FTSIFLLRPFQASPWNYLVAGYNGLNVATQSIVDDSAGGALLAKTFNEAHEILERISINSFQWSDVRGSNKKVKSVLEVDGVSTIRADIVMLANALTNVTVVSLQQPPVVNQVTEESCVYCGEEHNYEFYPNNPASVSFVGNQRNSPYSNFYNPSWCTDPNFTWGGQ